MSIGDINAIIIESKNVSPIIIALITIPKDSIDKIIIETSAIKDVLPSNRSTFYFLKLLNFHSSIFAMSVLYLSSRLLYTLP